MGAGLGRGSTSSMSEINVTPLVDVMLVLLIIFMVTAPLMQQGVKVDLPKAQAQAMEDDSDRSILTLTRNKEIFLGEIEIPRKMLRRRLMANPKLKKDQEIFLHADRNLPYGFVVDVMAVLKDAGIAHLGMVTDPSGGPVAPQKKPKQKRKK